MAPSTVLRPCAHREEDRISTAGRQDSRETGRAVAEDFATRTRNLVTVSQEEHAEPTLG